jgi:hypothetical protein
VPAHGRGKPPAVLALPRQRVAVLGVAQGKRRLLFLADGALDPGLVRGRAARGQGDAVVLVSPGQAHRAVTESGVPVLHHLWHGRAPEALELLRQLDSV